MNKLLYFFTITILFAFSINAQIFDWEWQNGEPVGVNLNDITQLPGGNYLAFGDFGTVMISTNGGTTWASSYVDTANGNRNIYEGMFLDATTGFACGTDGLLIKTTDGGTTWTDLTSGTVNDLWYIDMIDADTGYVCGQNSTMLKTTNGGNTWIPIFISATNTTLYKVYFLNASTGYLGLGSSTVGRLLRTTNYGATWAQVAGYTGTGTTRGIFFIDSDTGYVSNSLYQIWKTTNGGGSFTQLADFGTGTFYEIKFFDPSTGIAAGADGQVYITTNYGATWDSTNTSQNESNVYGLGLENYLGDASNILVCGQAGAMAQSNDLGITWQPLSSVVTTEILREIDFLDVDNGYAVGGNTVFSVILKTTNSGADWTRLNFDEGYRLYSQCWVNENLGFVGRRGPDGLFKTTDGGTSWTTLNPGVGSSTSIWYDIEFFDADTGYASGSSGNYIKTTDGGTTWTDLPDGHGTSVVYSLWMFDSQTIISAGASGKIYKTTDGGQTFSNLSNLGTTSAMYSLFFFDESTGYVAGAGGRAYKTTNGGVNWTQLTFPLSNTFYDVQFTSPSTGWISGTSGALMYTMNEGATWNIADKFPSTQTTYEMSIFGNRLWTCGGNGNILRGYSDPTIPVELTSFTARVTNGNIELSWQTVTEINNAGFDIERRNKNSYWYSIGYIPGNGTTTEINNYSFVDTSPFNGVNFYRLKQIDFSGTYEFSDVIEVDVRMPSHYTLEQNYPNPFNPVTTIKYSVVNTTHVRLTIYNSIGEEVTTLVNKIQSPGRYNVEFDGLKLSSGVYLYQLRAGNFVNTKKMILMK
jgi:photosystem II stability/assembly factor-like uncharacterized protein